MILSITGIVLGLVAIGLFVWFRRDQEITNDLMDGDIRAMENCYKALMEDFTNYQVESERKIVELEKQIETRKLQNNNTDRRIDKIQKSLPSVIGTVVGQIEFAQDTINRKR